jgi:major membrane immunogen (membrane-anchored lipoprotein)
MMKRTATIFFVLLVTVVFSRSINAQISSEKKMQDTVVYKDGIYTGSSRASYTDEPYWGIVSLTIKNNLLTEIRFGIRDSSLHENFDGNYEKHFTGNDVYIQQSRNDWKGVQSYPKKLSEVKDINKVDAVSGATWSHNIFKASVTEALKNAQ